MLHSLIGLVAMCIGIAVVYLGPEGLHQPRRKMGEEEAKEILSKIAKAESRGAKKAKSFEEIVEAINKANKEKKK